MSCFFIFSNGPKQGRARASLALATLATSTLVCCLASSSAFAQGQYLDPNHPFIDNPDLGQDVFNVADCEANPQVALQLQAIATLRNSYVLDVIGYRSDVLSTANTPCPELNLEISGVSIYKDTAVQLINVANGSGEIFLDTTVAVQDLFGTGCDDAIDDPAYQVCFYLREFDDINQPILLKEALIPALIIDSAPPQVPTIGDVTVGDGRITLNLISNDDDGTSFGVQYRPCQNLDGGVLVDGGGTSNSDGGSVTLQGDSSCGAVEDFVEVNSSSSSVTLDGLSNGLQYELRVRAFDDVDNPSAPSEVLLATPKAENSALDLYDGTPNTLSFDPNTVSEACNSCDASGPPNAFTFLALFLFGLRFRSRSWCKRTKRGGSVFPLMMFVFFANLAMAAPASAHLGQMTVRGSLAPTSLAMDSEVGPSGPVFPVYDCLYHGQTRPEFGIDAGFSLFNQVGDLQLTVGLGAFQVKGTAQPIGQGSTSCSSASDGTRTELTLIKVSTGLRYQADMLLDWFNIPLVPYLAGSVLTGGYAFTTQGSFDRNGVSNGHNPLGARLGVEASAGLMLELGFLSFLDPTTHGHKNAKGSASFDNAYVFADVTWQRLDSFSDGLILSPDDRLFGTRLPLLFKVGVAMELP